MFTKSAAFYDAIYAAMGKDYVREAQQVHALIQQHTRAPGRTLLDVACGTASHLAVLREWYEVAGRPLGGRIGGLSPRACPRRGSYCPRLPASPPLLGVLRV